MIHDAKVEVTCDGQPICFSTEFVDMEWTFGGYNKDDADTERELKARNWIVADGKHYCSQACADSDKGEAREEK